MANKKGNSSERSRFSGRHYLPPPSNKGRPHKLPRERRTIAAPDFRRQQIEKEQLRLLAFAYCESWFARDNPGLVNVIGNFNETMRQKLARIYAELNAPRP